METTMPCESYIAGGIILFLISIAYVPLYFIKVELHRSNEELRHVLNK